MRWPWRKRKRLELRAYSVEGRLLGGPSVESDPDESLRLSTVYACVDRLASTISTLPVHLYARTPKGNEKIDDHPIARLFKVAPNAFQTPSDFAAYIVRCLLLRGDFYARIYRHPATGEIVSLLPIDPDRVTKKLAPSRRRLNYHVDDAEEPLPAGSVWHIRGLPGSNFLESLTPIAAAAATIDAGLESQKLQKAVVDNTAQPRDIFETDGTLGEQEAKEFLNDWKKKTAGRAAGGAYILPQGLTHRQLSLSLADKEFIESRKLSVDEIAGIFALPRFLVSGDASPIATDDLQAYLTTISLRPWVVRIEQSFGRDCLTESEQERYFLRFNMDGLLRANIAARTSAYQGQLQAGILTVNEARALEDRPPLPRGDITYAPLNVAHIDARNGAILYNGPQNPIETEATDAAEE